MIERKLISRNPLAKLYRHPQLASRYVPDRPVDVWCPQDHFAKGLRYPVLYMHDGQNLFQAGEAYGGVSWGMNLAVTSLIEQKLTQGVIVVGIWNSGERRWGEYLPQKAAETPAGRAFAERFADRLNGPVVSDAYLKFIVEEVKPMVDAAYPTLPDRANTFVMGSSMGGLISLYALCQYPQVFGGAGCLSTHWVAGEQVLIDHFKETLPRPGAHRLYFDFGTETLDAAYEPFQNRMDDVLRSAGYTYARDWLTLKFPGASHNEASWSQRVHIPLKFLLKINGSA
jgi:predicted alpha/beta superfamily hydrolase